MKKIIYFIVAVLFIGACDEDSFLNEKPQDFMSASNSYVTSSDFDQSINELYYLTRYEFYCNGERSVMDYLFGTDLVYNASSGNALPNLLANYGPSSTVSQAHWDKLYLLVAQANTAISRLSGSSLSSDEQVLFQAKARFFRGLGYRTLAYLYGGVPLQLKEVTSPKTNYVRASRDEVIKQAISDVKFAAENLKDITAVKNGEISSPAAYHLLSELYLAAYSDTINGDPVLAKKYADSAITAATKVIENPALELMTSRFGSRSTETPGDVYWDLYRKNNQNRSSGNTEGVFVIQMELTGTTAGGTDITSLWSSPGSFLWERHCAPQTGLFRMFKNGVSYAPFTWPIGDYTGGRGIGSCVPTYHFDKEVWGGLGSAEFKKDIRNANHNFVRKFKFNCTSAATLSAFVAEFGSDSIDLDKFDEYTANGWTFLTGANNNESTFPCRYLTCYQTKCAGLYDYPSALYVSAALYTLQNAAGGTYTDQYMFRLAETYLLRAEAYLYKGQTDLAANDINEVRNRAKATPVDASDVTLDYILDERIRELGIEEKRRLTLGRLGADVFYDRVTTYNPYYSLGVPFSKTFTLYAIPQSAIDANKDAELTQNPGYEQ
jgi:starch-binding outer membrane protein, SusD/RagB family